MSMAGGVAAGLARLGNDVPCGDLSVAQMPASRMASAGGCTGGENVVGKTSEFAAAPVVADPLLVIMAGGVADRLARLGNVVVCGDLSVARLPPSRMMSAAGCTGGGECPRKK